MLSAPCISSNVIHKVVAFVAPKIIGGERAPSPVGELGFVEMTQAVQLDDVKWRQVSILRPGVEREERVVRGIAGWGGVGCVEGESMPQVLLWS